METSSTGKLFSLFKKKLPYESPYKTNGGKWKDFHSFDNVAIASVL